MSEYLSSIKSIIGNKKSSKRVGRGIGSGKGWHTATRGNKGQKSRSGGRSKIWFEGGQTPLVRRMPYIRGFINHNSKDVYAINLSELLNLANGANKVESNIVLENGLVKKQPRFVKILSKGKVDRKLDFKGFIYSDKAKEKIEKAGGSAK